MKFLPKAIAAALFTLATVSGGVIAPPAEAHSISGAASYYGKRFHGRTTANGERFDMHAMTAAHRTLPFGTKVRVTNRNNGKAVIVRINDRGPYSGGRVIDLSRAAAETIGMIRAGVISVNIEVIG